MYCLLLSLDMTCQFKLNMGKKLIVCELLKRSRNAVTL